MSFWRGRNRHRKGVFFFPAALTIIISPRVPGGGEEVSSKINNLLLYLQLPLQGQSTCCFIGASELRAEALYH